MGASVSSIVVLPLNAGDASVRKLSYCDDFSRIKRIIQHKLNRIRVMRKVTIGASVSSILVFLLNA